MLRFDTIVGDIPYLLLGIPLTLAITLVAFAAGILIALPIAVIRSAAVPVLSRVVQAIVDFFRTTPPLMHIVWAYYALPVLLDIRLDAFTVVAGALACSSAAQMSEIFRGAILAVPRGQWDAGRVIGLSYGQRLWWVILPQSLAADLRAGLQRIGEPFQAVVARRRDRRAGNHEPRMAAGGAEFPPDRSADRPSR